jgi:hypothetical protein
MTVMFMILRTYYQNCILLWIHIYCNSMLIITSRRNACKIQNISCTATISAAVCSLFSSRYCYAVLSLWPSMNRTSA